MGGGASAQRDTYVCRVADGVEIATSNAEKPHQKKRQISSRDLSAAMGEESKSFQVSNSGGGRDLPVPAGAQGAKSGASPVVNRKIPNSSPLQRANSRKMLGRSISEVGRLERQSSSLGKAGGSSSSGSKFKWLLKSGSVPSLGLSSLETERIIGTGLMGTVRLVRARSPTTSTRHI